MVNRYSETQNLSGFDGIREMDNIFAQEREVELPAYLEALMHYFGNSYICLWSYHPSHPSNSSSLVFLAGFYKQHRHDMLLPTTSSSSDASSELVARRHFNDYTQSTFPPLNDRVPGHAFTHTQPYVQLNEAQLMRMASILPQRLFYKVAMIKTAVFMGCRSGEIELGWSNLRAEQTKIENEMMKLFPEDFSRRHVMITSDDQVGSSSNHRPSSSTSSLRSTSPLDNTTTSPPPEYSSSFLINLTAATTSSTHHQPHLPTAVASEVVDAAITRALLAVFTSLPRYTTTTPPNTSSGTSSAFSNYFSTSGSLSSSRLLIGVQNRPSMFKKALSYYRTRRQQQQEEQQQQQQQQQHMPSTTQLHHMISERRRREKINHSFQSLRSLLPPHPKKDKATVLSRTQEYLKSLISQVAQLSERTQELESKLEQVQVNQQPLGDAVNMREPETKAADIINHTTTYERVVDVRLRAVEEMTSGHHQERHTVELQVTLLRDHCLVSDIVIRVLEFLRQLRHANLIAMEANTTTTTTTSHVAPYLSRASFTLQIEGDEWDEAAFQEAVRRVVADLAQ